MYQLGLFKKEFGIAGFVLAVFIIFSRSANAQTVAPEPAPDLMAHAFDLGGLISSGGVTTVSGAAGGGINPLALIGSYAQSDQAGGTVFYTHLFLSKYDLDIFGGLVSFDNRLELSYAHQIFSLGSTGATIDGKIFTALGDPATTPINLLPHALQLAGNYQFKQDIFSAKVRLFGNAVYDQDDFLPQVAVGYQYQHNENVSFVRAVGSRPSGNEFYIAATKFFINGLFGHYTLISATLNANNSVQNGLLGFGGVGENGPKNGYHILPSFTAAYWFTPDIVAGGEYRFMPHYQLIAPGNVAGYGPLGTALSKTSDWKTVFVAYFPSKYLSITAAYAMLGTIAGERAQNGLYLSATASF